MNATGRRRAGPSASVDGRGAAVELDRVTVRPATSSDLDEIVRVERLAYSVPWSEGAFSDLLRRARSRLLVADSEEGEGVTRMAGYAAFWWVRGEAELGNLAVAPDFRRRGVGGHLLDRLILEAVRLDVRHLYLEVRFSNVAALALYRSRGFVQLSVRKGYYERPREDARVLRLALDSRRFTARTDQAR